MSLNPKHYSRFLRGHEGNWTIVGFLHGDLAAWMPTLANDVRLGRHYAIKIWEKHNLSYSDLAVVQLAIDAGYCTQSRPSALDFIYVEPNGRQRRFILGLKTANNSAEVWVTTLYQCDEKELRRRLKRARSTNKIIRTHVWTS